MPRSRSPSFSAAAPRSSWLQVRARARLRATGTDPGRLRPDLAARRRLCRVRGRDSAGGDHPGAPCVVRRYGPRVAGGRRLLCAGRARRVDRITISSAYRGRGRDPGNRGTGEPARGSMRPVPAVAVGSRGVSAGGADGPVRQRVVVAAIRGQPEGSGQQVDFAGRLIEVVGNRLQGRVDGVAASGHAADDVHVGCQRLPRRRRHLGLRPSPWPAAPANPEPRKLVVTAKTQRLELWCRSQCPAICQRPGSLSIARTAVAA